jgi:hypothetical protein
MMRRGPNSCTVEEDISSTLPSFRCTSESYFQVSIMSFELDQGSYQRQLPRVLEPDEAVHARQESVFVNVAVE